jgi:hypothetical protein
MDATARASALRAVSASALAAGAGPIAASRAAGATRLVAVSALVTGSASWSIWRDRATHLHPRSAGASTTGQARRASGSAAPKTARATGTASTARASALTASAARTAPLLRAPLAAQVTGSVWKGSARAMKATLGRTAAREPAPVTTARTVVVAGAPGMACAIRAQVYARVMADGWGAAARAARAHTTAAPTASASPACAIARLGGRARHARSKRARTAARRTARASPRACAHALTVGRARIARRHGRGCRTRLRRSGHRPQRSALSTRCTRQPSPHRGAGSFLRECCGRETRVDSTLVHQPFGDSTLATQSMPMALVLHSRASVREAQLAA